MELGETPRFHSPKIGRLTRLRYVLFFKPHPRIFQHSSKAVLCDFFEEGIMRKLFLLLAAAVLMSVVPLSQSFAQGAPVVPGHHHQGWHPWPVVCGIVSSAAVMVGSELEMNQPDPAQRRQLTITEATWWASLCPVMLPLALISTATCADNPATVEVARLAYLYLRKRPGADQGAFTNAYAEACHEGRLSRATRRTLIRLAG
jgi:hypothetical protein